MFSFVTLDRMVEREMAVNPEYREKAADKPLRAKARRMTDEELLAKLRGYDIKMERSSLGDLCRKSLSAQEIVQPLIRRQKFKAGRQELEVDWIWIAVDALWQRWFPNEASFEMLDDKMQAGYEPFSSGDAASACRVWLEAWADVLRLIDKGAPKTIREFDKSFQGKQSLFNWVQQVEGELWNAGLDDRRFLADRIEFCEKMLEMSGADKDLPVGNFRKALAESWFELGEPEKADGFYRDWLRADPQWGWGWIGWADCYYFTRTESKNARKAEELLQEGLAVAGVADAQYIAGRLIGLYKDEGRDEEASELRRQFEAKKPAVQHSLEIPPDGNVIQLRTTADFGEAGLPLDELPKLTGTFRQTSIPAATANQRTGPKVGRNDPCPCGSGKKFKKCCQPA